MEAAWNRLELERPPNSRCRVEAKKFDVGAFRATLNRVIKNLNSQEQLHEEAALLSRLIYRMKSKFRNDKGVKSMGKLNRALLNYLEISLEKEYENLRDYVEPEGKHIALPSRQMVEYVLVRTQGFVKLVIRMEEAARYSAHFFRMRMSIGHAWGISIVAYAVVSRIWILARYIVNKCCTWYNGLYRYLKLIEAVGVPWLPKGECLPMNLKDWLAVPWMNEPIPSVPSSNELQSSMFKLLTIRNCDVDDDLSVNTKETTFTESLPESVEVGSRLATKLKNRDERLLPIEDAGEVVSRDAFNLGLGGETLASETLVDKRSQGRTGKDRTRYKENKLTVKAKDSACTMKLPHTLTLDNITSKSQLVSFLSEDSHPGLDKLRMNMIRNNSRKYIDALNACRVEKKEMLLLRKAIQRIRRWIT